MQSVNLSQYGCPLWKENVFLSTIGTDVEEEPAPPPRPARVVEGEPVPPLRPAPIVGSEHNTKFRQCTEQN